jgi:hypothetical protein
MLGMQANFEKKKKTDKILCQPQAHKGSIKNIVQSWIDELMQSQKQKKKVLKKHLMLVILLCMKMHIIDIMMN